MNYTEFQDALRAALRGKRGAQAELAQRLQINSSSVSSYVTGGNNIPVTHLDMILDILKQDIQLVEKKQ